MSGPDDASNAAQASSASGAGAMRALETSMMPSLDAGASQTRLLEDTAPKGPGGWPAFVARHPDDDYTLPSRGGLYDDTRLIETAAASLPSLSGMTTKPAVGPWQQQEAPSMRRPETPILAYVDRASMPGYVETRETETSAKQVDRDLEVQQTSSWSAQPADPSAGLDKWEAELEEWKRKYGCPDAAPAEVTIENFGGGNDVSELFAAAKAEEKMMNAGSASEQKMNPGSSAPMAAGQRIADRSIPFESMLNTDVDLAEIRREDDRSAGFQGTSRPISAAEDRSMGFPGSRPESQPQSTTTILQSALGDPSSGLSLRKEANAVDLAQREAQLARAEQQGQEIRQELGTLTGDTTLARPGGFTVSATSLALEPRPPSTSPPPDAGKAPGRRYEYTEQDLELAADSAMMRVKADGSWKSQYSETGLQKRDFFMDLRKQREKHKGRQATGPLWIHLATQAKNLASTLDLQEILEALKLFASVRLEDYELYMRLLGEVPHYVTQASASQLCELVRILARRRLRERNYVDMVAAHLLQKIRVTDDALPPRQLVKGANAFAALECRSNPKFVEHFLRHMEHRMHELDAELCCLVAPIFVDQYMNDALRRAYLCRCAETHAGFQCPLEEARNIACTELILRKEHHSLVVSLPPHVMRYLDKVQRHAQFDKWGAVTIPASVAPDGPKGTARAEMNLSLQLKASTAAGAGKQADVFSSDMHRDISACLSHLGIDHENGVLAGPYLLDIVAKDMVTPSKRIVFEVNSPHQYYEGTQQLTAEKRLRHRMINRLGHKLHMVNTEEWTKLSAAQKMTHMLKLQQAQQEENAKEERQKAAANISRAPLPALALGQTTGSDPMKLKSIGDLRQPIRVPVPPSQRPRQPVSAR